MESASPAPRSSAPSGLIAGPVHTLAVLTIIGLRVFWGALQSSHLPHPANIDRIGFYWRTIAFEWLVLAVVILGVRVHGSSVYTVLGERWRSGRDIARDVGIAMAFWLASTLLLSMVAIHPHDASSNTAVQAMLPVGPMESALWIVLSVSAGICEEAVYRGYLQRQMIAFTASAPIGILLAAAAFGVAHAYQGWGGALRVGLGGALLGVLAYARKSVRPGMIAHAFGDSFAGVLARLLRIRVG